MAKAKFNMKDFLLRRGEVVVMGVCGFFLFLMLIWGASQWGSANPTPTIKTVQDSAKNVHSSIGPRELKPEEKTQYEPPEWLKFAGDFKTPPPTAFAQAKWSLFDPVAQPSTKRENPPVVPIGEYQVNLTRSAMMGYDILDNNGKLSIAMQTTTTKAQYDVDKVKLASKEIRLAMEKNRDIRKLLEKQMLNMQPKGPIGPMGPMGPMGLGERGPMGFNMAKGALGNQDAQRSEKTIKYIPLEELETAVKSGTSVPAFTVIPVRLVTIHAVVPYKKQVEEIKKALRLPPTPAPKIDPKDPTRVLNQAEIDAADAQAKVWGPWYDGFEVQRRVTQIINGQVHVWEEWPDTKDPKSTEGNYKFEENYIARIDTKKIEDHLDKGYIPYFLKPEYMLAMPLPKLVTDLKVDYPEVKLKDIDDNIEKLKLANKKDIPPAEWLQQIRGAKTGKDLYKIKDATNALALTGDRDMGRFGPVYDAKNPMPMVGVGGMQPFSPRPGFGTPRPPEEYANNASASTTVVRDVDNFLLRFVDSNVEPGLTYQYRIRLRMINPNYKQDDLVAVPEYAKENYKILRSKWTELADKVTVPSESYVYAQDVKTYREQVNATYAPRGTSGWSTETDSLNKLLQVRDDQAVVQMAKWMDYVRVGDSTQREPIGGWVVGEVPVGRGEFLGKKQIVRLPLWSSETQQYVLREITEKLVRGAKYQPKGWVVDFTENQSVLADFSGGRVKTKANYIFDRDGKLIPSNRTIEEDAATELLIVQDTGKLVVRSSYQDNFDPNRKDILSRWTEWVKEVEKHKSSSGTTNEPNPFDPKKP